MIKFACPNCNKSMRVDDNHAGKTGKCPKCGNMLEVPEQSTLIEFDCESCNHTIKVADSYAGKKGRCPKCKAPILVPSPEAPPPDPDWAADPDRSEEDYEEEAYEEETSGPDRRLLLIVAGVATVVVIGIAVVLFVQFSGPDRDTAPATSQPPQETPPAESPSEPTVTSSQTLASDSGGGFRLQFSPASDAQHVMRLTTHMVTLHEQEGRAVEMENTQITTFKLETGDAAVQEDIPITITVTQIQSKTETQGLVREFDTADPPDEDDTRTEIYTPYVGKPFQVNVSAQGELTEVKLDALYLAVATERVEAEDRRMDALAIERTNQRHGSREGRIQTVQEQLEVFPWFGRKEIRRLLGQLIPPLPTQRMTSDTSWDGAVRIQAGMDVNMPATYSVTSLDETACTIEASGERTEDEEPFVYQAGTTTITNDMAGTTTLTWTVDPETGWLQHREQKTQLSGQMMRAGPDQPPRSPSQVTLEIVTTVELVE